MEAVFIGRICPTCIVVDTVVTNDPFVPLQATKIVPLACNHRFVVSRATTPQKISRNKTHKYELNISGCRTIIEVNIGAGCWVCVFQPSGLRKG